ncbi:CcmA ABC-type multidrug transport system, ATPase component [Rhabdaerophilaceae bacterium]
MHSLASILPLVVEDLCFEADGKRLLDGVSFVVRKGGVTAAIGPNGAGKSLLLRICHGLLSPSSGAVSWQGMYGERHLARHAMVFQRPVMLRRSVIDNVVHGIKAVGLDKARERAQTALSKFGLDAIADRPARLLSGGEQQRLAIARAWVLGPEVLFLDEPTSQLDPGAIRQIELIIETLAAEGMTILMTTHDLGQARRLSMRILFLNKGVLIEDVSTEVFFASPSTPEGRSFVAGELIW